MFSFRSQLNTLFALTTTALILLLLAAPHASRAAFTPTINYQGKLTDSAGLAVPDGAYNMRFWLLSSPSIATTSALWSETHTGSDKVTVTNGLFSLMLGSTTALSSVDFDQTLYLGVEIGGTGAASWDGEMSPRKIIGAVPAAFEAQHADDASTLGGVASTSFLRSDQADTASGLLTFTGGIISNASSTITQLTAITATTTNLVINGERFTDLTGTGLQNSSGVLTVNTTYLDSRYASSTQFDTCAELAAIMSGETGTCGSLVLSASPTFTGTVNAAALTLSSTLTLSGNTGSRALFLDSSSRATTTATSAYLANSITDETGSGSLVFSAAPTLTATTTVQGSFLVSGTTGSTPASGAGTRMMFVPSKGAFRAGTITGTEWDDSNIGSYSTALGYGTLANNSGSFAVGYDIAASGNITSSGWGSFAGGYISGSGVNQITASGNGSFAFGQGTGGLSNEGQITASGIGAVAMGIAGGGDGRVTSSGTGSFALGYSDGTAGLTSTGQASFAMGENVNATANNAFALGKGFTNSTASTFRVGFNSSPTFTVSSTTVSIGTTTVSTSRTLTIAGSARITGALYDSTNSAGSNGMVLQSTATGQRWVATSTLGISGGATDFLSLTDTPGSYNTGRLLFEAGSAVTDSANLTFANSKLTAPVFNASGASTTILSINNNAFLRASSTLGQLFIGEQAGYGVPASNLVSNGSLNFFGIHAGYQATTTRDSNFLGSSAGANATNASYSNFLGSSAGANASAAVESNFLGVSAGYSAAYASDSNFLGYEAGYQATNASYSNFFGYEAGRNATNASHTNLLGNGAGNSATNASYSSFFGDQAGVFAINAANSVFIGTNAGFLDGVNNTGSSASTSIAIGQYSGTGGYSDSIALGHGVLNSEVKQLNIGNVLYATGIYSSDTPSATPLAAGKIGIGTSSPSQALTVAGSARITGALYDSTNSAGSNGYVLKSTGSGTQWVATSSLGFGNLSSTDIDTSVELAAIIGDETGSGRLVFSGSPAFSGTATFSALTATSTLTLSGTAANIALGSNWLSGDGGDEGIFVDGSGNVGIGTTTPAAKLHITGTAGNGDTFAISSSTNSRLLTVSSAGYLGLGDSTPEAVVDANGSIANGYGATIMNNSTSGYGVYIFSNSSLNYTYGLAIDSAAGQLLYVRNDKTIGIGTSTPSQELSVAGDVQVTGRIYDSTNSAGTSGYVLKSTGTGFQWVATSSLGLGGTSLLTDGGATTYLTATGDNFAIGTTTSSRKLSVYDSGSNVTALFRAGFASSVIEFSDSNSTSNPYLGSIGNALQFGTNGSQRMLITTAGNVGIGTSTPNQALTIFRNAADAAIEFSTVSGANEKWTIGVDDSDGTKFKISSSSALGTNDRFVIDGRGYVGIGDTTPDALLDVDGTVTGAYAAHVLNQSATGYGQYIFLNNSSASTIALGIDNSSGTVFRVRGNGNVAIGTSTPNQALTIFRNAADAAIEFSTVSGANEKWTIGVDDSDGTKFKISSSSALGTNDRFVINGAGNVGINTDPGATYMFNVNGDEGSAYTYANIAGGGGGELDFGGNSYNSIRFANQELSFWTAQNKGFRFYADSDVDTTIPEFTIAQNGRVGVGTSTPSGKLHVYSGTSGAAVNSAADDLVIEGSGNAGFSILTPDASNANIYFATPSDGVGAQIQWNYTSDLFTIGAHNTGADVAIQAGNGTDVMRLLDSGNVGIGTTSPASKLDVWGNVRIGTSSTPTLLVNTGNGRVGIGTTTAQSLLAMGKSSITGSGIAGIHQYFNYTNSTADAVYYGDYSYLVNAPTATSTLVGKMLKIEDSTSKGNTVRGLEVQAHRGTNTKGENTALSGYGRTFGVRGTTEGDAGAVFQPAGVFAQTRGTSQGNAIRAYSASITTEDLVSFFQDTSAFVGTGLVMNFGNSGGSFSSTSSKFIDLQNAGVSSFTVGAYGMTTVGDGTTNHNAGVQIGYGGLCVDNDGTCNASTTGKITSVSSAVGNSDLAEMYFSSEDLQPGDIIATAGALSIEKADAGNAQAIIGVVSTKPGMTLGFDDSSLTKGQEGYPVALKGRVPVRLSTENGPIKAGDKIMLSSIPGVGMKATEGGTVVGIALEDYDGEYAYSEGFIDQFGDDIASPKSTPREQEEDSRINDGCYFGGGSELGAKECAPKAATRITKVKAAVSDETLAMQNALLELSGVRAEKLTTKDGEQVPVGEALMFVNLGAYQSIAEQDVLAELTSTSTDLVLGSNGDETLWSRLKTLAQSFVDGALSVFELRADRVYVQDQLCVDGVCVTSDDLRALLEEAHRPQEGSGTNTPPPTQIQNGDATPTDESEEDTVEATSSSSELAEETATTTDETSSAETTLPETGEDISPQEEATPPTTATPPVEENTGAEEQVGEEPAPEADTAGPGEEVQSDASEVDTTI